MRVPVPEDAVDGVSGAARARLHADDMVAWQSQSQSRYLFSDGSIKLNSSGGSHFQSTLSVVTGGSQQIKMQRCNGKVLFVDKLFGHEMKKVLTPKGKCSVYCPFVFHNTLFPY